MNNKSLKDFSIQELEEEIERRKQPSTPQPLDLEEIEWVHVLDYVQTLMADIEAGDDLPEDFEYELFDTIMDVVYGLDGWRSWWNKNIHKW